MNEASLLDSELTMTGLLQEPRFCWDALMEEKNIGEAMLKNIKRT